MSTNETTPKTLDSLVQHLNHLKKEHSQNLDKIVKNEVELFVKLLLSISKPQLDDLSLYLSAFSSQILTKSKTEFEIIETSFYKFSELLKEMSEIDKLIQTNEAKLKISRTLLKTKLFADNISKLAALNKPENVRIIVTNIDKINKLSSNLPNKDEAFSTNLNKLLNDLRKKTTDLILSILKDDKSLETSKVTAILLKELNPDEFQEPSNLD